MPASRNGKQGRFVAHKLHDGLCDTLDGWTDRVPTLSRIRALAGVRRHAPHRRAGGARLGQYHVQDHTTDHGQPLISLDAGTAGKAGAAVTPARSSRLAATVARTPLRPPGATPVRKRSMTAPKQSAPRRPKHPQRSSVNSSRDTDLAGAHSRHKEKIFKLHAKHQQVAGLLKPSP